MTAPILSARDAIVGFGRTRVAGPVSLACNLGEAVAVHGAPGSGKSAVLQMLMGRADLLGGSCLLFGRPLGLNTWTRLWRARIGAVWNTREAPEGLTAAELLTLVGAMRADESFADDWLGAWLSRAPFARRWSSRVATLSGGERTMLAAACALTRSDGGLLIFDDLIASLQPSAADELVAIIGERLAAQRVALVFSEESPPVRRALATRELTLRDG